MLSFENDAGGVGHAVERGAREVPLWVWLPWLPQLLMGLQRPEAPVIKQLLVHIAAAYPQVNLHSSTAASQQKQLRQAYAGLCISGCQERPDSPALRIISHTPPHTFRTVCTCARLAHLPAANFGRMAHRGQGCTAQVLAC